MKEKHELTIKEIQNISFEVLKKFKELCDKNGWKYYLAYGTLLGAVRDKGYIPWDDDVDVWLPRPDYEKFIKYVNENKDELKPFELIHYSNNKNYIYPIARLSDPNYYVKYNTAKEYGLGVFIDIYPLDGVNLKDKKYLKKIDFLRKKIFMLGEKGYKKSDSILKNIVKYPYYLLVKNINLVKVLKKCDLLGQKYKFEDEEWVQCIIWDRILPMLKKEWFDGKGECFKEFNGVKFRVPNGYDEILTTHYGDYMQLPPEEQRGRRRHAYSVYRKSNEE